MLKSSTAMTLVRWSNDLCAVGYYAVTRLEQEIKKRIRKMKNDISWKLIITRPNTILQIPPPKA